jgi:hypothetical protein
MEVAGTGDIIHAEGVRCAFPSSRPLAVRRDSLKFLTEIFEVVGADAEFEYLLDYRQEVRKGANRAQGWRIRPTNQPTGRRQDESVFDDTEGDAAMEEFNGQCSVRAADRSRRSRRCAIRFQDSANIFFLTDGLVHDALLNLVDRAVTGP